MFLGPELLLIHCWMIKTMTKLDRNAVYGRLPKVTNI